MPLQRQAKEGRGAGERSGEGAMVYKVTRQLRLRQYSLIWKSRRSIFYERWCGTPCLLKRLTCPPCKLQQASTSTKQCTKQGQRDATAR